MSRLYFHSEHGDAELRGSERALLGSIVNDITAGFLRGCYSRDVEQLLGLIEPGHYLHAIDRERPGWLHPWLSSFGTALNVSWDDKFLAWRGNRIDPFAIRLNTAMRYGSTPVRLAARLDGQNEIHCFVEGVNRAWLAGLIQEGLDAKVFRDGMLYTSHNDVQTWHSQGWDEVIKLLLSRDDEPVVCSYSVCDQFPNRIAADFEPAPMPEDWAPDWVDDDESRAEWLRDHPEAEGREEYYLDETAGGWYDLDAAEQWRLGMAGLRKNPGMLEISPDEFGKYYFAHGLALPDLLAEDYAERLDKAFDLETAAAGADQ